MADALTSDSFGLLSSPVGRFFGSSASLTAQRERCDAALDTLGSLGDTAPSTIEGCTCYFCSGQDAP